MPGEPSTQQLSLMNKYSARVLSKPFYLRRVTHDSKLLQILRHHTKTDSAGLTAIENSISTKLTYTHALSTYLQ